MNVALTDPFVLAQDYPETPTAHLRSGHSTCARFSRRGDFLASGRVDGIVVIFDVETNGVARKLCGHVRQIQSLSWSSDGRYLLSASQDWKVVLWDLSDGVLAGAEKEKGSVGGVRLRTLRVGGPVYMADMHPQNQ
jgi:COMPASS component SWD1